MGRKKELAKNTLIILIGKICTQFISFLLLPLYTSVLNTEEYGVVDLITTYVSLIVTIVTLQIAAGVFRFLIDTRNKSEKDKKDVISTSYVMTLVLTIITVFFYGLINYFINIEYSIYIVCLIIVSIWVDMLLQTARGLGDNIGYSIGSVISGGLTIILNVIFLVILKIGVPGMFLANIIANTTTSIFLFFKDKTYKYLSTKNIDNKLLISILKYSLPLVPNGIMWWILNVSDRTILTVFVGISANGIYAVANKFPNIITNIFNIFRISWNESATLHINDEDASEFISSTLREVFNVFSSVCLCMISGMFIVFPIMINDNYSEAYKYIPILSVAILLNIIVSFFSVIYTAKKMSKEVAKTSLYSAMINLLVHLGLVKYIGVYAAAISTLVAFGVMSIYRYIDVQKYLKIKFNNKILLLTTLVYFICIVIYYLNNIYLKFISLLIAIIYSLYCNKNIIKKIMDMIVNKCKNNV